MRTSSMDGTEDKTFAGNCRDGFGDELRVGDRVSWPVIASCGSCFFCERRLPQKCDRLRKGLPHMTSFLLTLSLIQF